MKLNEALKKDLKQHWISIFIKSKLRYSFKRGSTKNHRAKSDSSIYAQTIFRWKLMNRIFEDRLVFNIDESSFGRSIRTNYSWLPKSQNSGIINTMCSGRLTLIWGLANSDSWMCMTIDKTTTTKDFGVYMYILRSYINKCDDMKLKVITAVVDNTSIHLTSLSKSLWRCLNIELLGLPQYCPHLAPVELIFGMTKRILIRQVSKEGVDFSKPEGQTAIIRALESLTNQKAFNM